MKLESFCYQVVMKTIELLESKHHYKIPEDTRKEIAEAIIKQMDSFIEK